MNALVITDLHAHTWPRFARPMGDGLTSRVHDLFGILDQLAQLIAAHQPTDLLVLGDVFHRRHFISFRLFNAVMARWAQLCAQVEQTVFLVGNHDLEGDRPDTHSLYPFSFLPHAVVIDRPEVVHLADGDDLMAIPYDPDPLRLATAFERAPVLPVISHYAAEGCQLETDYWLESPVKLGALARFPVVLFGHVHKPSDQLDGKVVYVGAPMHFDFGDVGPRYAVRVADGRVERHPLHAPQFETHRWPKVPTPAIPGRDFLRLLAVPPGQALEAQAMAQGLGWAAVVALEELLPPETRQAVASGLIMDEATLVDYTQRANPQWVEAEVRALAAEGWALLQGDAGGRRA